MIIPTWYEWIMRWIAIGLFGAVAACELVLPITEQNDASGLDASGDVEASDGPINLLENPGFEVGTSLCGTGWSKENSVTVFALADAGHDGGRACRVCSPGKTGITQHIAQTFPAGTNLVAGAWIGADSPSTTAHGRVFVVFHGTDGVQSYNPTTNIDVTDGGWNSNSNQKPVPALSFVDFFVQLTGDGGCMLVDDAWLSTQ